MDESMVREDIYVKEKNSDDDHCGNCSDIP